MHMFMALLMSGVEVVAAASSSELRFEHVVDFVVGASVVVSFIGEDTE